MANMDYCKFENTSNDIMPCLCGLAEGWKTSERECEKAENMFTEILMTMADLGIIDVWDGDLLHDYCQEMNENNEEE